MIELAPRHKYGCPIAVPLMPAAGAFGFGEAYHDLVDLSKLGAVVTNPVSLRPRRAASGHRIGIKGDHFVVHTGWPNPGLHRLMRQMGGVWARLPIPVIVHLLATRPPDMARAAARLSGVQNVRGIELGFAEDVDIDVACDLLIATSVEGDLPVIAKIPFGRVDDLAPALVEAGADAVTLMASPRAVLPLSGGGRSERVARFIRGRLYGPALFPMLLHALSRSVGKLSVPVIACGGIASGGDALACLTLGAAAVQVDALLWRDPLLLNDISDALVQPAPVLASVEDAASLPAGSLAREEDI